MILSPTLITYVGFTSLTNYPEEKYKILLGLIPIVIGLFSIYFWVHVKIFFDQLCKASQPTTVKPQPPPPPPKKESNVTIAVMAPYPPYDKNYSIYDGAGFMANPNMPHTPLVVPPTPIKKDL